MEKNFSGWSDQKTKIDSKNHKAPFVTEGDIWWAATGVNVGSEMNGKNELYSRPVIILKKLAHNFYFVIPTTTQEKAGSWYISFVHSNIKMTACLHQARSIDYRRILGKLGSLNDSDYSLVKESFLRLYK